MTKKNGRRRDTRGGTGQGLMWLASQEAFRDAWYALVLDRLETFLKDPKRQQAINHAIREVFHDLIADLEEKPPS